jgi:hypothetical protein
VARCRAGHEVGASRSAYCPGCRRDEVVDLVAAAEGSLPRPVVGAAVSAVASGGQALRQLALALSVDPAALSHGAPPVAGRLTVELIARGSTTLAVPSCLVCGRMDRPLFRGQGGGVCQRCRSWQLARACVTCGKVRPLAGRDATGQPVCEVCRRRDDPRRRRVCGVCGQTAPAAVRARDDRPAICVNCYRMPQATCSVCGRWRACSFAATDRPICVSCTPRTTATCARCGTDRPPAARWPEGRVCDPCYTAALRHRGTCVSCGQQRRLVAPPGRHADTCADCAGIPVTHACTDCGTEDKLYEKGRCARCSLRRRTRQVLSAGTDTISPLLTGVFDAVTAAAQPRSALNWLRKGAGARLLADMAAGRLPLTHQALDTHPRRRAADYLRDMLTATGALPPRDEPLARTGQWLAALLEGIEPAADRRLVQAYATWQVMRRLRASAAANVARPRTPTAHARTNIRAAISLLAWLRGHGTTLAACGQADIDQWLGTGPSAVLVRDFLTWAATRHHCRRLAIPAPTRRTGPAIADDHRWTLAGRLLHDTTLEATDRVAGCLLLLYGQPLSRIAAMTTGQATDRDDQTFIRLGRHDAPVPDPLADAIRLLITNRRSYRGVGSPPDTTWLFPGLLPGRPITAARLGERLRTIGIYAQTARRAALLNLAAQLPAAVLADLLGLHETTAAKWMHQAGGDWSRYAAQLTRDHPHQP